MSILHANVRPLSIRPSTLGISPSIQPLVNTFECTTLNAEKIWIWQAWPTTNKIGNVSFLPLYPIYERLGKAFTQRFFTICRNYLSGRNATQIPGLKSLIRFIGQFDGEIKSGDFLQREFMDKFWHDFFVFYVTTSYDNGSGERISTIITKWRGHIVFFIKNYLELSGLVAEPWGEIPNPEPRTVLGANTNIRSQPDGSEVKTKLLTHIPLEVTDEKAIELLLYKIEHDISVIRRWAKSACDDLWKRNQRRENLAPSGKLREILPMRRTSSGEQAWLTDRRNPEHLANACATFKHHGYLTKEEGDLNALFPVPLRRTADELGLPTTDSLIPHCFLLVLNHPCITPSFLEKLEVFDKSGKLVGFQKTDGGYRLIGFKHRRGPNLSQQIIALNKESEETVRQILEITSPLREWLRNRDDDQWRYLLLTSKKGFGYPQRVASLSSSTSGRKVELAKSVSSFTMLPHQESVDLVDRLSLPTVRASAGILVYLKTKSLTQMATALGHAEYSPALIERYLPKPILEFFQERWIRIFQTGIIVEALKESPFLLAASGFSTLDQLHEFLSNHALKVHPKSQPITDVPKNYDEFSDAVSSDEIVFGLNAGILTALMSLKLTVDQAIVTVDSRAKYWAAICEHLVNHIETNLPYRADLCAFVKQAKMRARPLNLSGITNE